jgi:methyl-accepting chemotaxis protein
MATEEGVKGVDHGVRLAAQSHQVIDELSNVIVEATQSSMQMAAGGQQQLTGIEQLALAMQSIHQATLQSLASTRQAEKAAQNLNDLASQLAAAIARYNL